LLFEIPLLISVFYILWYWLAETSSPVSWWERTKRELWWETETRIPTVMWRRKMSNLGERRLVRGKISVL